MKTTIDLPRFRKWPRIAALCITLGATLSATHALGAQVVPVFTRPSDAAQFTVTAFATGLAFPTSMTTLADGSLLVASTAGGPTHGLFGGTGQLVRLTDFNNDGIADGPPQILASGFPGVVTSVRRVGNTVIALSTERGQETISFFRTGASASDPLVAAGALDFTFPVDWQHTSYALAARPTTSGTGVEVYFNVGAFGNQQSTPDAFTAGLRGAGGVVFADALVHGDGIYRVVLSNSGPSLTVSAPVRIASGLRNAAGLAFDAAGNLYLSDNGFDDATGSLSADELNRINAADLGVTVPDFGFANTYVRYSDGVTINPNPAVTNPLLTFRPIGTERSEGAVEIAFAPASFGANFLGGVFTAFYGENQLGGLANNENPLVFANPNTGEYYHFFENQQFGSPVGLLSTPDALYLADMTSTGNLFGLKSETDGVIYRIAPTSVVPEPGTWRLLLAGMLCVGAVARRRAQRRTTRVRTPRQA